MTQSGAVAARGRHHQPHPARRLHRRHRAGHRAVAARPPVELPHRGLHRAAGAGAAGRRGAAPPASPLVEDLGSGNRRSGARPGSPPCRTRWPPASTSSASAATRCSAGRRPGLIIGRAASVDRLRRHPLMRALRVDKLIYAALEAHAGRALGRPRAETVPVLRMLHAPLEQLRARAEALAATAGRARLAGVGDRRRVGSGRRQRPGRRPCRAHCVRLARAGWSADRLDAWLRGPGDADHRPHPGRTPSSWICAPSRRSATTSTLATLRP